MKRQHTIFKRVAIIVALLFCVTLAQAQSRWLKRGSDSSRYEMAVDPKSMQGDTTVFTIRSLEDGLSGFGTYMQRREVGSCAGKRIKMWASMRTANVKEWASFWLRIDQDSPKKLLKFDNMQERGIKGTTGWASYEIVLDVPQHATSFSFGAMLNGVGQIWFTEPSFVIVDEKTAITGADQF